MIIIGLFKVHTGVYDMVYNLKEHGFLIVMIIIKVDEYYLLV